MKMFLAINNTFLKINLYSNRTNQINHYISNLLPSHQRFLNLILSLYQINTVHLNLNFILPLTHHFQILIIKIFYLNNRFLIYNNNSKLNLYLKGFRNNTLLIILKMLFLQEFKTNLKETIIKMSIIQIENLPDFRKSQHTKFQSLRDNNNPILFIIRLNLKY